MIQFKTSTTTTAATLRTDTTVHVVVPGPGYQCIVQAIIEVTSNGNNPGVAEGIIEVNTDVEGAGSYADADDRAIFWDPSASGQHTHISLLYALTSMTPGKVYGFRLFAQSFSGNVILGGDDQGHRIVVQLVPPT